MIAGPHAIGKTTTAKKLAEIYPDLFYVPSFAQRVARDMGYDLNKSPSPREVLAYQERVLMTFQMSYEATFEMSTLYDRSPLDFAVYTCLQLRDCDEHEIQDALNKYIHECIESTKAYCDCLIIPQADLTAEYESKDNRPEFSDEQVSYREDYAALLEEYTSKVSHFTKIIRVPVSEQYDDRIAYIMSQLELAL
jgi:hypothetical protein